MQSSRGYCNTLDTLSQETLSKSIRKRKKSSKGLTTKTWGWGTAGSGGNVGQSTLGGKSFIETNEFNAMSYIEMVKKTFRRTPDIYKEFKQILSEIRRPESNKIDLIKRVVLLFDGYMELLEGFAYFLPQGITMEVQHDAVVINVEEDEETDDVNQREPTKEDEEDDTDMMRYIRNVRWTYMHQPGVYDRFNRILQEYNRRNVAEMETINKIVELFEGQPDLVQGFNVFLPAEYRILEHKSRGYVIKHPCRKGLRPHFTPITVKEVYAPPY